LTSIQLNVKKVKQKIWQVALRADRDPEDIQLVAVTKNVEQARIHEAIDAGITDVGENRVQELLKKQEILGKIVKWHLIGHLQTNKVKFIMGEVALIHALDRIRLAAELDRRAEEQGITVTALVQVNVAGEATKYGLTVPELMPFLRVCSRFSHLRIQGLMTIAPYVSDPEAVRPVFAELRRQFELVQAEAIAGVQMRYLSMGMTNDFEVAIAEGANLVRIGTAIFGSRQVGAQV